MRIVGIDDAGSSFGPIELGLEPGESAHFNSTDLETGNLDKGISEGLGDGVGDWRLNLDSDVTIEALAYVRTSDGFVTTMYEVVPVTAETARKRVRLYRVRLFNPASNRSQRSLLRLVNPNEAEVNVVIEARDDTGSPAPGGAVRFTLRPGEARTLSSPDLEAGGDGLVGVLGDGRGKWQLFVHADGTLLVVSLLQSPTGHLSNLSAPGVRTYDHSGIYRSYVLGLFLPASESARQSFARIINHSNEAGAVNILGIDDAGNAFGPIEFNLEARAAAHFNSEDLERGNAEKGLPAGLGDGEGSWRLYMWTALNIEPLSYIRTEEGFLTAMHQVVPPGSERRHVQFFNPGSNHSQRSLLRLINRINVVVDVNITGLDDSGTPGPGGGVNLALEPLEARTITAQELEGGGEGLLGAIGDGRGKWHLFVSSDGGVRVQSLLESPTGHLANLSDPTVVDEVPIPEHCDQVVDIPDSDLRSELESVLSKAAGHPISQGEMATLRSFAAWDKDIESLQGLGCATELTDLAFPGNRISDLSPIAGLKALTGLGLQSNQITDLSPLAGLTSLHGLGVDFNRISDVSPVARMHSLVAVNFNYNRISDVSPLASMKALWQLGIAGNPVEDLSPLAEMTALSSVDLHELQISDLSPLAGLQSLRVVNLSDNQISNVLPLSDLTGLTELHLRGNRVSDISPLAGMVAVEMLWLSDNQISDIGPLVSNAGLGTGDTVYLFGNPLSERSLNVHIPALRARGVNVLF